MFHRSIGDAIYAFSVMAVVFLAFVVIGVVVRWFMRKR